MQSAQAEDEYTLLAVTVCQEAGNRITPKNCTNAPTMLNTPKPTSYALSGLLTINPKAFSMLYLLRAWLHGY